LQESGGELQQEICLMKPAGRFRLCVLFAGTMLLLSSLAAFSDSAGAHSKFAGSYVSKMDKPVPSMTLSLGEDGTATVTEDAGKGALTHFGHWVDSGAQVTVTFDAEDGRPAAPPMVFQPTHEGLQAVTWDHADWGNQQPPPMKKGHKVKEKYWFTTVP
jgi:hypothetical protein